MKEGGVAANLLGRMDRIADKTVMVGMSGGVDSSVSAALLLAQGYRVLGGFMKNWSDGAEACGEGCGWERERQDALKVAAQLGIPFFTFDFEKQYRERVVGYMVREYAAGRTPNPDVLCNSLVKFDLFLPAAHEQGAELVATGHYARRRDNSDGSVSLLTGVDANKDQSYFLHQLSQKQLQQALFPVGELTKPEVRELARKFGLPTADKKDSQGLCFVGKVDMQDFLQSRIQQLAGPILTVDGVKIGEHAGLAPYTIGQRHGFGGGGATPYVVVRKDVDKNILVVAPIDRPEFLLSSVGEIAEMHWIAGVKPKLPLSCQAQIRYRQTRQAVEVSEGENGRIRLVFAEPQRAITAGQFAVLYQGDECLGGGPII